MVALIHLVLKSVSKPLVKESFPLPKPKKIIVIATYTAIFKYYLSSKVVVSLFNLSYFLLALLLIDFTQPLLEQLSPYIIGLFILTGLRLWLIYFKPLCGKCYTPLKKSNRSVCAKCGGYNVHNLDKWKVREFATLQKVHQAELKRILLELLAILIVSAIFIAPLVYYSWVVLNQPVSETIAWLMQFLNL